jgi:TubC N-terminal docking domain
MNATAILQTIRARGGQVTLEGDTIRVGKTSGVLTDELRQAIRAEKAAILSILAAEQKRARKPLQGNDLVALKVWSALLQEAIWVVADGVPVEEYLGEGKDFTPREVRVLRAHGRGVKAWAPLDAQVEGCPTADHVPWGRMHEPAPA